MPNFSLLINPSATPRAPYGDDQAAILNANGLAEARAEISSWPGYAPTPLVDLSGLARLAGARCRAVYTIGDTGETIAASAQAGDAEIENCTTLDRASSRRR